MGGGEKQHEFFDEVVKTIRKYLCIDQITKFKIGMTGKTLEERFSSNYQQEGYSRLMPVYASGDKESVTTLESDLIVHFLSDPEFKERCLNEIEGAGEMADSRVYQVYLALK